jgi:hypothetical protein
MSIKRRTSKTDAKIYSFKETDKDKYQNWNDIPIDHPIVEECRKKMFQIIREQYRIYLS